METYYCPYCSINYKLSKDVNSKSTLCSSCGDPLIKRKHIRATQIVAILIAISFITPLVLIVFSYLDEGINNFEKEQLMNNASRID